MDVTRLRTLTLKSTLKFGKWHDLILKDLITMKQEKAHKYLTWLYYSADKISFNQEILDILGITKGNEIEKPGKIKHCDLEKYLGDAKFKRLEDFYSLDQVSKDNKMNMINKEKSYCKKTARIAQATNENKINSKLRNRNKSQKNFKSSPGYNSGRKTL